MVKMPEKSIWTDERCERLEHLSNLDDLRIYHLYKHAVDGIEKYSNSSEDSLINLMHIAHDARELINSFAELLEGKNISISSASGLEHDALIKLRETLINELDDDILESESKRNVVTIPVSIAEQLLDCKKAFLKGNSNSKNKDSLTVLGYNDPTDPSIIPWKKARNFFQKYAHIKGSKEERLPEKSEVLQHFSLVENAISIRLGLFFDAKSKLTDVLEEANEIDVNGEYSNPNSEEINRALSNLGNNNLKFVFFSNLENPKWLKTLDEVHAFHAPSEGSNHPWYEEIYLKKQAANQPEAVVKIVQQLIKNDNQVVRGSAIEITSMLPPSQAATLVKPIKGWADQDLYHEYFWDRQELIDLIGKLLQSEDNKVRTAGKNLFTTCFAPIIERDWSFSIHAIVPEYSYGEKVDQLIEYLKPLEKVGIFERYVLKITDATKLRSDYLVPSIQSAYLNNSQTVKSMIVRQLVDAYSELLTESRYADFVYKATNAKSILGQRCALFTITSFLRRLGSDKLNTELRDFINVFVLSEAVTCKEIAAEYYPLAQLSVREKIVSVSDVVRLLKKSYDVVLDDYKVKFKKRNVVDIDPKEYADEWLYRALSLIGQDLLDRDGKDLYRKYKDQFGERQFSIQHDHETETMVGPNSPLSKEEMRNMGADGLVHYLYNWHPSQDDELRLVSHDGLAGVLSDLVKDYPSFFQGKEDQLILLRPSYQRGIVSGWNDSLHNGKEVPTKGILVIATNVTHYRDTDKFKGEGKAFDDDFDYQALKLCVVSCLDAFLSFQDSFISDEDLNRIRDVLVCIAKSTNPDETYEMEYIKENADPLTGALNTIRPSAIRALSKWLKKNNHKLDEGSVLDAIEACFPNVSNSACDAAALGESLPILVQTNFEFIKNHYEELFGKDSTINKQQQIVLSTILGLLVPNPVMLDYLRPACMNALNHDLSSFELGINQSITASNDCAVLLGSWLYEGLAVGWVSANDGLLEKWRDCATAEQLGLVLARLCGKIKPNAKISSEVIQRIGEIWDYHKKVFVGTKGAKALRGISALARSHQYSGIWWGSRFCEEYKLNPRKIKIIAIRNELIELSQDTPELALDILDLALRNDEQPHCYTYEKVAISILKEMKNKYGDLSETAKRCMNKLGTIGCIDLDEKI